MIKTGLNKRQEKVLFLKPVTREEMRNLYQLKTIKLDPDETGRLDEVYTAWWECSKYQGKQIQTGFSYCPDCGIKKVGKMKMNFRCTGCGGDCRLEIETVCRADNSRNIICPFYIGSSEKVKWEIVEVPVTVPEKVALDDCDNVVGLKSPLPEQKEVLPDWCQPEKMVFVDNAEKPSKIESINEDNEIKVDTFFGHYNIKHFAPATLIPWTKDTGPDGFVDANKKEWRKCPSLDEKMEWGYLKVCDKCWCSFEHVMKSHKLATGESCGEWVKKEVKK